ncbi:MAG: hypothetical protein OEW24_06770 [Chloroflexota bacterium]|nr:hypothetical protein [Chloroflexota bacterium]
MRRSRVLTPFLALLVAIVAGPAAGVTDAQLGPKAPPLADHLGGSFTICGRISAFAAPLPATPGSLTVEGVIDFGPHTFPIDHAATVDPLLAGLAAADAWTCLDLIGDGGGVLTSLVVPSTTTQCGPIDAIGGGAVLGQQAGSTHEFTTLVLDGKAATVIAADADLSKLLTGLAADIPYLVEACLDLGFAADGTLTTMVLDYHGPAASEDEAAIACGPVDGTPVAHRDPASQPYPAAGVVSVNGFALDATLVDEAFQDVLSFSLDAGLDVCLLIRVVNTAIVETGVLTSAGGPVCGELEVIGGQVFVDAVLIGQALMTINLAEPTPSSIAWACASALAQEAAVAGTLDICGDFQGTGPTTLTISGVTFHFDAPVVARDVLETGGPQSIGVFGPNPLAPLVGANVADVHRGSALACSSELPATNLAPGPSSPQPMGAWVGLVLLLLGALLGAVLHEQRPPSTP